MLRDRALVVVDAGDAGRGCSRRRSTPSEGGCDPGLRAELLRHVLVTLDADNALAVLPDTA